MNWIELNSNLNLNLEEGQNNIWIFKMCNSYPQFQNQIHGTGTPSKIKRTRSFWPWPKGKIQNPWIWCGKLYVGYVGLGLKRPIQKNQIWIRKRGQLDLWSAWIYNSWHLINFQNLNLNLEEGQLEYPINFHNLELGRRST